MIERAKELLAKNRKLLDRVSANLMKKETLTGEEFATFFGKTKVPKKVMYSKSSKK